jgi:DNA-binding GntR family transcriptional regulator
MNTDANNADIKHISAHDVVEHLKQQIKFGTVVPGQRLVETEIMKSAGATRGRVRDALKILATEGLVQIEEFKGASVKRLTRTEVVELYQLREVNEGLAARLAAQRTLTKAEKAQMLSVQKKLDAAERERQQVTYKALNDEYHRLVLQLAGNSYLSTFLERLQGPIFQLQFRVFIDSESVPDSNADHAAITQAIIDGDPQRAETLMRRHIAAGLKVISKLEDRYFG